MIPVPKEMIEYIDIPNMAVPTPEEAKYKNLLQVQYRWCQQNSRMLQRKAERLHHIITNHLSEHLSKRCCDFLLLESKCKEYEQNLLIDKKIEKKRESTNNK